MARSSKCCAVFGHFHYIFASFDSQDFKFSATSDGKGPGCVAEFCAMPSYSPRNDTDASRKSSYESVKFLDSPFAGVVQVCQEDLPRRFQRTPTQTGFMGSMYF